MLFFVFCSDFRSRQKSALHSSNIQNALTIRFNINRWFYLFWLKLSLWSRVDADGTVVRKRENWDFNLNYCIVAQNEQKGQSQVSSSEFQFLIFRNFWEDCEEGCPGINILSVFKKLPKGSKTTEHLQIYKELVRKLPQMN